MYANFLCNDLLIKVETNKCLLKPGFGISTVLTEENKVVALPVMVAWIHHAVEADVDCLKKIKHTKHGNEF